MKQDIGMRRWARVALAVALGALASLVGCATRYPGPASDHFDGRVFRNAAPAPSAGAAAWGFVRWRLFDRGVPWPARAAEQFDRPPPRVGRGELRVSYVGHATVLVQFDGLNILTDPVWSERASPLPFAGPRRVRPPAIAFEDLPPIDLVLVSHNHYDHLDPRTLARLWRRDRATVIAPLGNLATLRSREPGLQAVELDWGQTHRMAWQGVEAAVSAEPMQHWSARGPVDQNLSLWAAFVIRTEAGAIYFAGDTGYGDGMHFRAVGARHGPLRLALLPVGGYEPRWFVGYAHMNPEEAVQAGQDLRADHVLGHHWATFRLTNEAIDEPGTRFLAAAAARSIPADAFRAVLPGTAWWITPAKSAGAGLD